MYSTWKWSVRHRFIVLFLFSALGIYIHIFIRTPSNKSDIPAESLVSCKNPMDTHVMLNEYLSKRLGCLQRELPIHGLSSKGDFAAQLGDAHISDDNETLLNLIRR